MPKKLPLILHSNFSVIVYKVSCVPDIMQGLGMNDEWNSPCFSGGSRSRGVNRYLYWNSAGHSANTYLVLGTECQEAWRHWSLRSGLLQSKSGLNIFLIVLCKVHDTVLYQVLPRYDNSMWSASESEEVITGLESAGLPSLQPSCPPPDLLSTSDCREDALLLLCSGHSFTTAPSLTLPSSSLIVPSQSWCGVFISCTYLSSSRVLSLSLFLPLSLLLDDCVLFHDISYYLLTNTSLLPVVIFNINTSTDVQTHICNYLLDLCTGYCLVSYTQQVHNQIHHSPFSP